MGVKYITRDWDRAILLPVTASSRGVCQRRQAEPNFYFSGPCDGRRSLAGIEGKRQDKEAGSRERFTIFASSLALPENGAVELSGANLSEGKSIRLLEVTS
jgi:hypothetical protein